MGDVPWGTHFCHLYETKQDLLDTLVPFFRAGLEDNEFCIWVVAPPLEADEAQRALAEAVPGADRYLAAGDIEIVQQTDSLSSYEGASPPAGRIEILPHTEWHLKGGEFVADRVLNGWKEKVSEALAKGYRGLRANGNISWLSETDWNDFLQYERDIDKELGSDALVALCSYPLSRATAGQILEVVNSHEFAVIRQGGKWEIVESGELKETKDRIDQLDEELKGRVAERTLELLEANDRLQSEIAERRNAEEQLKRSNEELRLLSARLHSVREEESVRIAREIHDELGSTLASVRWELEDIEETLAECPDPEVKSLSRRVGDLISVTDTIVKSVKRIVSELRPTTLDELGLVEALQWHARQFQDLTGITVKWDCALENHILEWKQSTAVFRIFQEALTNILRHAQATEVDVALARGTDEFVLVIRDNGIGFDDSDKSATSLGLLGMRERAHGIGASISIQSAREQGTEITLRFRIPGRWIGETPC